MKKIRKTTVLAFAALFAAFAVGCATYDNPFNPDKNSSGTEGGKTGGDTVAVAKKIELAKNIYAETPQVQVKIPTGFASIEVGDMVKIVMKGTSEVALGNAELFIVDTTEAGGYWYELSEKAETNFGTAFDYTYYFTIEKTPKGTGDESRMLVINGLDGDQTRVLDCSEFSIVKNASSGEPATDPATPTTDPATTDPAAGEPATEPTTPTTDPAAGTLEKTSIIAGIQAGENVWGSGTDTAQNPDGTYTVKAAGEGEGGWGGKIAAVPVMVSAGDLDGFTHVVVEADFAGFEFSADSEDYPSIELKFSNDDTKSKVIAATSFYKEDVKTAEIPLEGLDFASEVTKIMVSFRGTGSLKLSDISKAK